MIPASQQAQTVVTLNNISVSLLENGYFEQALELLHIMQQQHFLAVSLQGEVTRALALAQQPPKEVFTVDVVVLRDDDVAALRDASIYGPSSSMAFAVRLVEAAESVTPYMRAVCLHNLATAYRCHYAETNHFHCLVGAQHTLRHCHQVLLQGGEMLQKSPSYLWSITEFARERTAEEQHRHVEAVTCTPHSLGRPYSQMNTICLSQLLWLSITSRSNAISGRRFYRKSRRCYIA